MSRTPEQNRAHANKWYHANKERAKASRKAYYEANKDRMSNAHKQWRENNRDRWSFFQRSRKVRGMMQWHFRQEIEAIYAEARRITAETGVLHVVDHIWPLKHPLCCGLHVPWNLQIITGTENDRKGNRLPSPDLMRQYLDWLTASEFRGPNVP